MSVKMMGEVWQMDLPHQEILVLLALSDHADHEGKHVHPSLSLIAWKTGYSVRQVRRIMRQLESQHILKAMPSSDGIPRLYSLHPEHSPQKASRKDRRRNLGQNDLGQNVRSSDETQEKPKKVDNLGQNDLGQNVLGQNVRSLQEEPTNKEEADNLGQNDLGQNVLSPLPPFPPHTPSLPPTPLRNRKTKNIHICSEHVIPGENHTTESSPNPPTQYAPGFTEFWKAWPAERRTAKPKCFALWQRAHLESRAADIVAQVEALKSTHWHGKDPQYIPLTLTWLNQGRYEDDTPQAPQRQVRHSKMVY